MALMSEQVIQTGVVKEIVSHYKTRDSYCFLKSK